MILRQLVLSVCSIVLLTTVCAGAGGAAGDSEGADGGVLRVLTTDFAPFFHLDEEGQPTGLEQKILASFAAANDLKLEVVWVEDFSDIIPALLRGDGDLIASTLTITRERARRVDFSAPYFPTRVVLVTRQGGAVSDLDSLAGKTAVTIAGTTYEEALSGIPEINLRYVATEEEMYAALVAGEADGLATDSANFLWLGKDLPELVVSAALSDREFYGFAVRQADPLKAQLDGHMRSLMENGLFWDFVKETYGELVADSIDDLKQDFLAADQ
jgi:polar amino acid transport system substrate-binding protein